MKRQWEFSSDVNDINFDLVRMTETVWASEIIHEHRATTTHLFVDGIACGSLVEPNVEQLLKLATPAPFGKGDQTVFDPTVRLALQIEGKKIALKREVNCWTGNQHTKVMVDISPEEMNSLLPLNHLLPPILDKDLEAKLYKLHIYPTGGHFGKHTDTQHANNHVISGVVQLGSAFTGGALHLDDSGLDVTILSEASLSTKKLKKKDSATSGKIRSVSAAAWYTDLTHWVDTVTSGNRVVLQFDVNSNIIPSRDPHGDTFKKAEAGTAERTVKEGGEPVVELYGDYEARLFKAYREPDNEGRFIAEGPALVDRIRSWLESHPKEELAILLHHRYLLRALENEVMKGSDLWLFETLHNHFRIEFQTIAIETEVNHEDSSNNTIQIVDIVADPINVDNIESLLDIGCDAGKGKESYTVQRRSVRKSNPKTQIKTTLFLGKRTGHLDNVRHIPYAEHTGNESQMGEDSYMTACMVLRKKA